MRLSEWRSRAPSKDAMSAKVLPVIEDALAVMAADPDPECWVAWGDDPQVRYTVLVPTGSGLLQISVRVNVPGSGPRASGKLVRWSRVQVGELGIEIHSGHRLVSFQIETLVLQGADALADAIGAFAHTIFAAIDGRPLPGPSQARTTAARRPAAGKTPARRAAATPTPAAAAAPRLKAPSKA
jgi:hypothetical protein